MSLNGPASKFRLLTLPWRTRHVQNLTGCHTALAMMTGSVAKLCPQACRAMIVVGLATERSTVVDFKGSHFEREIVLWGVRW
jgi:hypothetical protein